MLARLPDAPAGTRGISLLWSRSLRWRLTARLAIAMRQHRFAGAQDGHRRQRDAVLNFDGAVGTLIGEPTRAGSHVHFMNTARIGTAIQGVAHASCPSKALALRPRAPPCARCRQKEPEQVADALIWHPDVRRMLLTQKPSRRRRAMVYGASKIADKMFNAVTEATRPSTKNTTRAVALPPS